MCSEVLCWANIFKSSFVNANNLEKRAKATHSCGYSVGFGDWEMQFCSCLLISMTVDWQAANNLPYFIH